MLISGDLTRFKDEIQRKLEGHGFNPECPTLFLSECVLIYLQVQDSDRLIQELKDWTQKAPRSAFLVYEQVSGLLHSITEDGPC